MKIAQLLKVFVVLLTCIIFLSVPTAFAASPAGTSHAAPITINKGDDEDEPDPPSKPSSSKVTSSKKESSSKTPSSKSSSSSKASSSKKPISSKEPSSSSKKPTSSRAASSEKIETPSSGSESSRSQSSNCYLFSLRVVNRKDESIIYSLTPAFSKEILAYSVSVPADVTGVALYGTPEDSANARVEYHNMRQLTEGEVNRLSVVCVAGNGERKTYVIDVSRGDVASSETSSLNSSREVSSGEISLPSVVIGDISSDISLVSVESKGSNNLFLGILAWVFLLGGLVIVVLVILNSSPMKKSIGSTTVGAYTPNTRHNRMKKPRRKAKKRLLNSSYYSKYSRYKH